jgi:hypothetical protein
MTKKPDKMLLAAMEKLEKLRRQEAFDPVNPNSKPTPDQQRVIDEFGLAHIQLIRAGTQCLAKGTLVATPTGPVAIEDISVGDTVYSEHGTPIKVLKTFDNGRKSTGYFRYKNQETVRCTTDHRFLIKAGSRTNAPTMEASPAEWKNHYKIVKALVKIPGGDISYPQAYALGALLGDGCSRASGRRIIISGQCEAVISKVANCLNTTFKRVAEKHNYDWSLGVESFSLYEEWCRGKYAHEKTTNIATLRQWDRESLISFVAGLIDTDGTLFKTTTGRIMFGLSMQAKPVVDAFVWACQALWQVKLSVQVSNRAKYKNGPIYDARTSKFEEIKYIFTELNQHIQSPQKQWKPEYDQLVTGKSSCKLDAVRPVWVYDGLEVDTYDIHVDSPTNLYLLANGLVTHNSGKSQTCARLLTWMLTDTHPKWKKPAVWGSESLLALVAGRTGRQIEESLLPKIRSYLEPGTFKEVRIGNIIQRLELTNGNRIVFQSLENPNMARERIQSYVAHIAWIDELPPTVEVMDELLRRIQARNGYFLASFTPLVRNVHVQRFVDNLVEPAAKTYRFRMLDNPLYADKQRQDEIMSSLSHLPEHVRNSRLYGEWMSDDNAVFHFDYNTAVAMPQDYSPLWRHVESVDPAIKSALGYTLWAEEPSTAIWYCIKSEYIKGVYVPTELVKTVAKLSAGYNIVRRISDPHESWYIHTAASMGISYTGVYKKNDRKSELIKNFQEELGKSLKIAPTCDLLIDEITSARWSDTRDGKIASGSDYHLLDSSQYFQDVRPKREAPSQVGLPWEAALYAAHIKRKQTEEKQQMKLIKQAIHRKGRRHARQFS